jgi:RsiW-degrading membrane proteinase PrsW (M82 family)
MSDIRVVYDGRTFEFAPGTTVGIGRAAENDIVIDDPTVSREHARLVFGPDGWVLSDEGRGRVFSAGGLVDGLRISGQVELRLASPSGPLVRVELVDAGVAPHPEAPAAMPDAPAPILGAGGTPHPGATVELLSALHILVPIRSWLTNRGWRTGWRILVIPYALLPLIFVQLYSTTTNATTPGWAYSLYIAPLWAIAFYQLIRPGRLGRRELACAVLIVGIVLLWMQVVTITINNHLNPGRGFPTWLGVGFNEEFSKALPILLIALLLHRARKVRLDVRMWMFLGTISGLTFGVREASLYTASSVLTVNHHPGFVIAGILEFAYRVFVDGFLHAIWAGIAAFFIGMGINYARRRIQLIVAGIVLAALLHALNDWNFNATNVWPQVGVEAFSLLLFLGYTLTASSIERQVRRSPVFRGESILVDQFSESSPVPQG